MYIFLDIDGVLVREDKPGAYIDLGNMTEAEIFQFEPECQELFESVILRHTHALIVISSSWIEVCPLETITALFSPAVATRVKGATPRKTSAVPYFRHQEVLNYLQQNGLDRVPWVAIDDIRQHFAPGAPIIVTDPYSGFNRNDAERLDYFLSHGHLAET